MSKNYAGGSSFIDSIELIYNNLLFQIMKYKINLRQIDDVFVRDYENTMILFYENMCLFWLLK